MGKIYNSLQPFSKDEDDYMKTKTRSLDETRNELTKVIEDNLKEMLNSLKPEMSEIFPDDVKKEE